MKLQRLTLPFTKTTKFCAWRLAVYCLGVSLLATTVGAAPAEPRSKPSGTPAAKARAKSTAADRARARVARIRAARARGARALAEAKTPRFRTDADGNVVPDVRAAAAIISIRPPAQRSRKKTPRRTVDCRITKVMTAIVFLESATDLGKFDVAPTRFAHRRPT